MTKGQRKDENFYLCIDLKSFYASVECRERGLDPMTTNLVVADPSRGDKTICLAATPAIKKLGVSSRCRVFEIPKSIDYIMAPPRMSLYMKYSARVYKVYLKYFDKDDIHIYSIDEVFIDASKYSRIYGKDMKLLAKTVMEDVYRTIGIRSACGIGTNLYLCKIALDITAKHSSDGIGYLDEKLYRQLLWNHRPITDFWRIGRGTAKRLERYGIYTMEQIAKADKNLMFKVFGVDAELIIDHAWGRETATMADIKGYEPKSNSISSGQVLFHDYNFEKGRLILHEMTELLVLDLVDKKLVTDNIGLYVGFSNRENIAPVHGSMSLSFYTSSMKIIQKSMDDLYCRIIDENSLIRRISISFNRLLGEENEGFDLFTDTNELKEEKQISHTILDIKKKFGKNAIFKGMNLEKDATTLERNRQIGGHKA
ncbi:MAG: DNA repair protein [Firmicutes bacterium]|nr:DNA repair protein [Bacillota bacterium]